MKNKQKIENHYRYERDYGFDPFDEFQCYKISLITLKTRKETNHGYWISTSINSKQNFVLKKSKKRFAYPTKSEALNNFKLRTEKSVEYSIQNLKNAENFLELSKTFKIDE